MGAYQIKPHAFSESYAHGITEVVLPGSVEHEYAYILPMLAHLSRQSEDRWFTWIAPRGINRQLLMDYGFALDKVRIIYTHNDEETSRVLWDALSLGNSSTVVVSHEGLCANDISNLEEAARIGGTQGLLLRHRRENW